jgi:DNA-3-methyladenine glycosylase
MRLPKSFFSRSTVKVARELLGQVLVHETPEGTTSGKIVEVEAYLPKKDPGCHAARGKTSRNEVMFGPAGHAYVYFCYGAHFLFNVVTEKEGVPGAVLLRALEPLTGEALMARRRGIKLRKEKDSRNLTNGPGKLVQAMGLSRKHNRTPLFEKKVYLKRAKRTERVGTTTRIGITEGYDLPLRFYLK